MQKSRKYYFNETLKNYINNKFKHIINNDNYGIAFVDPNLIINHYSIHTKINSHKVNRDNNGNYFIYAEENINPNLWFCIFSRENKSLYVTQCHPKDLLIKEEKKESNSKDIDERHIYFHPTVQRILETQFKNQIEKNKGRNWVGIAFGENEEDANTLLHTTNILKDQHGYYVIADEEVKTYPVFVIYDGKKKQFSKAFDTKEGLLGDFIPLDETTQIMAKKYKIFKEEKDEIKEDKKENENNINKINFELDPNEPDSKNIYNVKKENNKPHNNNNIINNNVNNINNINNISNINIDDRRNNDNINNINNIRFDNNDENINNISNININEERRNNDIDLADEVKQIQEMRHNSIQSFTHEEMGKILEFSRQDALNEQKKREEAKKAEIADSKRQLDELYKQIQDQIQAQKAKEANKLNPKVQIFKSQYGTGTGKFKKINSDIKIGTGKSHNNNDLEKK